MCNFREIHGHCGELGVIDGSKMRLKRRPPLGALQPVEHSYLGQKRYSYDTKGTGCIAIVPMKNIG